MIVEICANSFESAKAAQEGGADRIELCTDLSVGGLTPHYNLIDTVTSELDIPVHVLIRPRSGNFTYSGAELDTMLEDIAYCKDLGCAGIVSGILTPENDIDIGATRRLIAASEGMEFTFHRGFDLCRQPQHQLASLIELGVTRLLSSGQQPLAIDGIALLKELITVSAGKIEIMPGSGINPKNALAFKTAGFKSIHASAIKKTKNIAAKSFFESGHEGLSDIQTILELVKIVS